MIVEQAAMVECGIRSIEKQFEPNFARRIRGLVDQITTLRKFVPQGVTPYYCYELCLTLEAGALLASLNLASLALELFVRESVLESVSKLAPPGKISFEELTFQERLEENKQLNFSKLIDHLVQVDLFDPHDGKLAKKIYQDVRIPLSHGLSSRLIYGTPDENCSFLRLFGAGMFLPSREFEYFLEDNGLKLIKDIIDILSRNCIK